MHFAFTDGTVPAAGPVRTLRVAPMTHFYSILSQAQLRQHRLLPHVLQASPEEERQIEEMKRNMEKQDIWESESLSNGIKVAVVVVSAAVVISLLNVATPIIDNTVNSFPGTPP